MQGFLLTTLSVERYLVAQLQKLHSRYFQTAFPGTQRHILGVEL